MSIDTFVIVLIAVVIFLWIYPFRSFTLPTREEITSFGYVHYFIYQDGIISEMTDTVSFGSASKQKAAPLQIALVSYFVGNILHVLF